LRILGYLFEVFFSLFNPKAPRTSRGVVWFIPHEFNKFNAGCGGMLSLSFLVFFLPSLAVQSASRLLFLLGFWFCLLLFTHFSLHVQGKWHAGWLGLVFCLERDVCAAAMGAAGSGGRSRLQLRPCFRSLLLPSLFSHSTLGDLHIAGPF